MTAASSVELVETARKSEAIAIQAISRIGQEPIAQALSVSEPTVSRIKNEEMPRVLKMLAAAGCKVVGNERVCVKRDEWAMVTKIAARALSNETSAASLLFEEPE